MNVKKVVETAKEIISSSPFVFVNIFDKCCCCSCSNSAPKAADIVHANWCIFRQLKEALDE